MPSVSQWQYNTSAEMSGSVLVASGGSGTLYFSNPVAGSCFAVDYSYLAFGPGGEDIGGTISSATMWSTGSSVVNIVGQFDPGDFPRGGWLVTAGGTTGPLGGFSGTYYVFNNSWGLPVAFVAAVGESVSALPGLGAAIGGVTYGAARVGEQPPSIPATPPGQAPTDWA